ncbi:MAG: carboxypeptidase-like regulatory domain-containing protein [Candidatus Dormibacterales bacterium]
MRGLLAGLALVALAACGSVSGGSPPRARGLVTGHLYSWPTCPVESLASPCPPRPVPNTRIEFRPEKGGGVVVTTTDGLGGYRVRLAPGTYLASVELARPMLGGRKVFRVSATEHVVEDLTVDSGIR